MKTENDNKEIAKPKGIVKEFDGYEIEEKFQLIKPLTPSFLTEVKSILFKNPKFSRLPGFEHFEWVFHFDYYAYSQKGDIKQAFAVVHHPSTPRFWVRKKGVLEIFPIVGGNFQAWVLKRKESEILEKRPFTNREIGLIIQDEKDKRDIKIFPLPRLTREKYYTFVKNNSTSRTYSLSLDFCHVLERKMSQLEIEYKWRDKKFIDGSEDINSILEEFRLPTEVLLTSNLRLNLIPTKLTKFEWLLQISDESKKN